MISVEIRHIRSGWSLAAWREDQYRPFSGSTYRALIVDFFKWRFEFRVPR